MAQQALFSVHHSAAWFHSGRWDGFWLLSGFWLPLAWWVFPWTQSSQSLWIITLLLWISHRFSSLYTAWCVNEYVSVRQARPFYFVGLPVCLLLVLAAFLLPPESLMPLPRLQRFLFLALIDYFFSLYHFAIQHYGVLSVYRARLSHGQNHPQLLRWDWLACLGVSGLLNLVMDYSHGEWSALPGLSRIPAPPDWLALLAWPCAAGVGVFAMIHLGLYWRYHQGIGRMLYLGSLYFLTGLSLFIPPVLYLMMTQIQHWLVAVGLSSYMASHSKVSDHSRYQNFWLWFNQQPGATLILLCSISVLATPVFEADLFISFGAERVGHPDFLMALAETPWIIVLGLLAFWSALLHYIYDRGVYRFSDPLTRQAALSLLQKDH